MKIVKLTQSQLKEIASDKAIGLSAHFERLSDGQMPTRRSPLFKGTSESDVRKSWQEVLDAKAHMYPRLVEYENTRWSKFGPQGGYPPLADRMQKLELYFTRLTDAQIIDSSQYQEAIKNTRSKLFRDIHSLRALTPEQVLNRDIEEDKLQTNSGLPDFSKRNNLEVRNKAVSDAKSGKWRIYPSILGSRSSRGKDRFIFMFPMSTNLVEKQYVIPIMDAIRSNEVLSFAAWEGFADVEMAFYKQKAFDAQYLASMDYEGMDQTMGPNQMQIVYDILAPVFQPQYRKGLYESLMHCVNVPIMIDKLTMVEGKHGLASGSGWTNLSESVISQFVHDLINLEVLLIGDQLLGDDGAMTTNSSTNFADAIEKVSQQCGLLANAEKQRISSDTLVYLQRFFDKDITIELRGKPRKANEARYVAGSYPTVLALNAGMNPERFHDPKKWNARMETLRWIMILENCHHSPLYHDIIEFFIKGDKYRLGIDWPGWLELGISEDYELAKSVKGFVPSYNQANIQRKITQFDTVRYLIKKMKAEK